MFNYVMSPHCTRARSLSESKQKFNTHLASKRSIIECAFDLLGLRFPCITYLKFKTNKKHIKCVVTTCVLHNCCLMQDDDDEAVFDFIEQDLEKDINDDIITGTAVRPRANSGGVTKRDILTNIIQNLN